ncbi:uncharacterized protein EI97DRAFT_433461 [Westerdykella ornata]|uniref:Tachykinin family protein n=1 Tax=Westerdykella ornata TaxID=318751 RepID=A0A6A6JHB9_WESOR|nr:uncharacterized protein EI97DRAFT_433461 [Westerdykella ornata]KAF2276050.1 hypothetical protein EI97DRAFT_433461 [Westerdykella ornata]
MTAPPTQRPIFTAPFLSPDASVSLDIDATSPWATMGPFAVNAQLSPRKSPTPPSTTTNERKKKADNGGALLFITGTKPADFKARGVMTQVRKQAMDSYLKKEKRPRKNNPRSGKQSEDDDSQGSTRGSVGSEEPDVVDAVLASSDALSVYQGDRKRKPTSSIPSPASSGHGRTTPDSTRIPRIPPVLDMVLSSAPIVQPMRAGIPLPYMQTSPRPFQSIGKPFDPFRTMFQSHHPFVSVEELKWHCSRFFGTRAMGLYWIPTLVKSPHAFLSTLCIASTHYDAVHNAQIESLQTTALRQEVIHLIHQNILNPETKVDDYNIIALTQLIASEIIAREDATLGFHEAGIEAMVRTRGGLNKLGVNGRLAHTLSWVSIESAILREAKPKTMYTDFLTSYHSSSQTKSYPPTATLPESPLYVPRGEFTTLERSTRCSARTLDLLKDIRMMLDLFLHETKRSRQNAQSLRNIYKRITMQYPTAAMLAKTNVMTAREWTYESLRVAAVVLATAIVRRCPLSEALGLVAGSEGTMAEEGEASKSGPSTSPTTTMKTALRHDSPVTTFSTLPSYTSTAAPPSSFASQPQQNTYTHPSIASTISTSSSHTSSSSPSTINTATSTTSTSIPPPFPSTSIPTPSHPFFPTTTSPAPPPPPSQPTTHLLALRAALENSNLSDCWGDMAGVLLWISLVMGAATAAPCRRGTSLSTSLSTSTSTNAAATASSSASSSSSHSHPTSSTTTALLAQTPSISPRIPTARDTKIPKDLRKWFAALVMRCSITLCFEHPVGVAGTVGRMGEVVEMLGEGCARDVEDGIAKRRRRV